jgi:hypothetical protein
MGFVFSFVETQTVNTLLAVRIRAHLGNNEDDMKSYCKMEKIKKQRREKKISQLTSFCASR